MRTLIGAGPSLPLLAFGLVVALRRTQHRRIFMIDTQQPAGIIVPHSNSVPMTFSESTFLRFSSITSAFRCAKKVPEVPSGLRHRSTLCEPRADKLAELPGQAELHAKRSRSRSVDRMTYQRRTFYGLVTVARALGIYLAKAL